MRAFLSLKTRRGAWFYYTALFAVFSILIFWGAWSPSRVPVMPDCPTVHSSYWFLEKVSNWLSEGRFVPGDVCPLLGGPALWQELQYVVAVYFGGLGLMYFLLGRRLHPLACAAAALFLSFSGYWFTLFAAGHFGWFQWMTYGTFAFGLIDRLIEKGKLRHGVMLGAVLAWASFYQPDLWLLFTLFSFAFFIFSLTFSSLRASFRVVFARLWKGCAVALLFFVLIGSASFYHAFTVDLGTRKDQIASSSANPSKSGQEQWLFVTNWSLPPAETAEFFFPRHKGDTSCPLSLALAQKAGKDLKPYTGALGRPYGANTGNYRQHSLYFGNLFLLMALLGVICACCRKSSSLAFAQRRYVFFFLGAAVLCWLLAMGRYCEPLYRLIYRLPFGDLIRAPVKWLHLTEFALAVVAAYGADALIRRVEIKHPRALAVAGLLIALVCLSPVMEDKRFCQVYPAQTVLQPLPFQVLQDPRARQQLQQMRAIEVGRAPSRDYAVYAIPSPKNDKCPELKVTSSLTTALGILSLLATLTAIGIGVKRS